MDGLCRVVFFGHPELVEGFFLQGLESEFPFTPPPLTYLKYKSDSLLLQ